MQDLIYLAAATTANRTQTLHAILIIVLPAAGALAFCFALVAMVKRKEWRRTQAVLMFIAGLGVAGASGIVRDHIEEWLGAASTSISAWAFGVVVSYLIGAVLVFWLALDLDIDGLIHKMRKSKKGSGKYSANAFTPWLALLTAGVVASIPYLERGLSVVTGGAL